MRQQQRDCAQIREGTKGWRKGKDIDWSCGKHQTTEIDGQLGIGEKRLGLSLQSKTISP